MTSNRPFKRGKKWVAQEWVPKELEIMRKMASQGATFSQIGDALNRTKMSVVAKAKKLGIKTTTKTPHKERKGITRARVAALYKAGLTQSDIAKALQISTTSVHVHLKREGLHGKLQKPTSETKQLRLAPHSELGGFS